MQMVIYPGTFDPITLGHLDLIERTRRMFAKVIVAVGNNPAKGSLFSAGERLALVKAETAAMKNVEVRRFNGLLVEFARKLGVSVVVRGMRTVSDFEYELQMALTNRAVSGLETVFLTPRPEYQFLSAQLIREMASMGGEVSGFLSPHVEKKVAAKFKKKSARCRNKAKGAGR